MSKLPQSSPGLGRLPACLILALVAFGGAASAQERQRAASAAALLKEAGGIRLGSLVAGVSYPTGRATGGHVKTTVDGWMLAASTQASARDGFDLAVTAGLGAAIRSSPGGSIIAQIQEGTLLSKVSTRGRWVRVRRAGWVARGSLRAEPATKPASAQVTPPPAPPPPPVTIAPKPVPARQDPVKSPATSTSPPGDAPTGSDGATLRAGAVLSATPDGKPAATLAQAGDVQVVERTRDWTKVRFEGWVRNADVSAEVSSGPRITAAMLRDQPQKYLGQSVLWRVQYLAVQKADALRPEIPLGQPYVLARGPLPESGFTYIIVTNEQAAVFRQFAPLDEVAIEAVIRAGRTKYLPTPVLELVKVVPR